jgi:hypothetical protein
LKIFAGAEAAVLAMVCFLRFGGDGELKIDN